MTYIPSQFGASGIASNALAYSKLAQAATHTLLGNSAGSTANLAGLTGTQATALLDAMVGDSGSGGTKGLVSAPAAGDAAAGKVWTAAGIWDTVSGGASPSAADYTPVVKFGGGTTGQSYDAQVGRYFQIGDFVFVVFAVDFFNKGSSTGIATMTLPVPTPGTFGRVAGGMISHYSGMNASLTVAPWLNADSGGSALTFWTPGAGAVNSLADTDFTNSSSLRGFFIYLSA